MSSICVNLLVWEPGLTTGSGFFLLKWSSNIPITVEELKTKLFKTSRPKSALIINEACEKGFFYLQKTAEDQRKKNIKPTESFVEEFEDYLKKLREISL